MAIGIRSIVSCFTIISNPITKASPYTIRMRAAYSSILRSMMLLRIVCHPLPNKRDKNLIKCFQKCLKSKYRIPSQKLLKSLVKTII